jgi:hypothetical protein
MYKGIVYVPDSQELKNLLLKEMHNVPYAGTQATKRQLALSRNNTIGQV